ncbi:IclR family transcriptional regulator [Gordonia rhizosphera]|uniref:Putative IclR family transcriptional regulator n=1 Tax=Gordonia rhizosphera NBRC 16068 TaxID=1108045 RepID=K6V475_9ACTN|nr:IclR family transcriptional regulator [Gordonia rhizosphera]GAB90913.1 putative IclR family transcriptional regulator [Gordonia rhizosphera NBRC 16068]
MAEENSASDRPAGAVERALQIMELIGAAGTAGVTELALELGVHKSTVSRIISSLEARGFVEQAPDGRKYRIGLTVVRLAGSTMATLDMTKCGQDMCDTLAAQTGETANLAVLADSQAINVIEAAGSSNVALQTWVGQASPAYATSSGKVLLAGLTESELRTTLSGELTRFTDNTIVDLDALVEDLAKVRRRGWAMAVDELEVGLVAIAAPVRDHTGAIVWALSVSGPRYRLDPDDAEELTDTVVTAAADLSRLFGYRSAGS